MVNNYMQRYSTQNNQGNQYEIQIPSLQIGYNLKSDNILGDSAGEQEFRLASLLNFKPSDFKIMNLCYFQSLSL